MSGCQDSRWLIRVVPGRLIIFKVCRYRDSNALFLRPVFTASGGPARLGANRASDLPKDSDASSSESPPAAGPGPSLRLAGAFKFQPAWATHWQPESAQIHFWDSSSFKFAYKCQCINSGYNPLRLQDLQYICTLDF